MRMGDCCCDTGCDWFSAQAEAMSHVHVPWDEFTTFNMPFVDGAPDYSDPEYVKFAAAFAGFESETINNMFGVQPSPMIGQTLGTYPHYSDAKLCDMEVKIGVTGTGYFGDFTKRLTKTTKLDKYTGRGYYNYVDMHGETGSSTAYSWEINLSTGVLAESGPASLPADWGLYGLEPSWTGYWWDSVAITIADDRHAEVNFLQTRSYGTLRAKWEITLSNYHTTADAVDDATYLLSLIPFNLGDTYVDGNGDTQTIALGTSHYAWWDGLTQDGADYHPRAVVKYPVSSIGDPAPTGPFGKLRIIDGVNRNIVMLGKSKFKTNCGTDVYGLQNESVTHDTTGTIPISSPYAEPATCDAHVFYPPDDVWHEINSTNLAIGYGVCTVSNCGAWF